MRGEYPLAAWIVVNVAELPPHARRILFDNDFGDFPRGTTSACAENTFRLYIVIVRFPELPPHARRIHARARHHGTA